MAAPPPMDPASPECVRMIALERENQALRDQVRDLQHLLQVKDQESALKYSLLQAKERENAQARARLQLIEAAARHAAEAEAARLRLRDQGVLSRDDLLRLHAAARQLRTASGPPEELVGLGMADRGELEADVPETPSKGTRRTPLPSPSGGSAARSLLATPKASDGSKMATPKGEGSKRSRSKKEPAVAAGAELVWKARHQADEDPPAEAVPAARAATKKSPKKPPPPALGDDVLPAADPGPTAVAAAESPQVTPGPSDDPPLSTPSKRMAIVDPMSGKEILVTPSRERSSVKPTMISLEAISEGSRKHVPLSPAGPSGAPPLTLPPVVVGAPPVAPLSHPPQPLHYPGALGLPPAGAPAQPPVPPLGYAHGVLASPLAGHPPPGAAPLLLGGASPPCPPPLHAAPTLAQGAAEAPGAGAADGPVQMARGPLAGAPRPPGGAEAPAPGAHHQQHVVGAVPGVPPATPPSLLGTVPLGASSAPMDQLGLVPPRGWAPGPLLPPSPAAATSLLGHAGYAPAGLSPPTGADAAAALTAPAPGAAIAGR